MEGYRELEKKSEESHTCGFHPNKHYVTQCIVTSGKGESESISDEQCMFPTCVVCTSLLRDCRDSLPSGSTLTTHMHMVLHFSWYGFIAIFLVTTSARKKSECDQSVSREEIPNCLIACMPHPPTHFSYTGIHNGSSLLPVLHLYFLSTHTG